MSDGNETSQVTKIKTEATATVQKRREADKSDTEWDKGEQEPDRSSDENKTQLTVKNKRQ